MNIKTSELTGVALDWAVSKCEKNWTFEPDGCDSYSTDWAQGGPIIERERIEIFTHDEEWFAYSSNSKPEDFPGDTQLIAAMRCYVASQFGDTVDIPEELV
jgi:hypothetical protein